MAKKSEKALIEAVGVAAVNALSNMGIVAGKGCPLGNRMGIVSLMVLCGRLEDAAEVLNKISADVLREGKDGLLKMLEPEKKEVK